MSKHVWQASLAPNSNPTAQRPNASSPVKTTAPVSMGSSPPRPLPPLSLFLSPVAERGLAPRKKISNGQKGQSEGSTDSQLQALFLLLGAEGKGGGGGGGEEFRVFFGSGVLWKENTYSPNFHRFPKNFKSPNFCNMFRYGSQNIKGFFKSFFFHLWSVAKFG